MQGLPSMKTVNLSLLKGEKSFLSSANLKA